MGPTVAFVVIRTLSAEVPHAFEIVHVKVYVVFGAIPVAEDMGE